MDNKKVPKKVPVFSCKDCDYTTVRKSQYKRHLSTQKHKWITSYKNKVPVSEKKYICDINDLNWNVSVNDSPTASGSFCMTNCFNRWMLKQKCIYR